jgi:hypothetical protein
MSFTQPCFGAPSHGMTVGVTIQSVSTTMVVLWWADSLSPSLGGASSKDMQWSIEEPVPHIVALAVSIDRHASEFC